MCTDRAPWDSLLRCTKRKVPSLFLSEVRSHPRSLASGPNPGLGGENGGAPPTRWPLGSKSASVPQWETDLSWKGGIVGAPARSVTTKSMAMVGIPQQILRAA